MSKEKGYEPFEGFKQISEMWENQLNGLLYKMTDNNEFVRMLKVGTESHSRYMELLRKNQELLAGVMNVPTKTDIANVAKLSIQAEEKIDILEEQIWNLQDSLGSINKENLELFQEMIKVVKQMKAEFQQTFLEVAEINRIKDDFHELRQGLVEIKIIQVNLHELRQELEEIKVSQHEIKGMNNQAEMKLIHTDLKEVKLGLSQLSVIKEEIAALKGLLEKERPKAKTKEKDKEKDKEKELVASK